MNNDHHILAAIFSNYPDFLGQKAASLRTLAAELAEQSSSGVCKTDQKWKVAPFLFRFFRKRCLSHPCLKLCATWMDSATVIQRRWADMGASNKMRRRWHVSFPCQTYQHQQTGAVSGPSAALSTWAILCSLVPDGLGLAARSGQLRWSPNVEGRRPRTR